MDVQCPLRDFACPVVEKPRHVNLVTPQEVNVRVELMLLVAAVGMVPMRVAPVWVLEVMLLVLVRTVILLAVPFVRVVLVFNENYYSIQCKDIV
jgi:hypothetical protein